MRRGLVMLACGALLAGCGSSNPPSAAPSQGRLTRAFRGSPPQLAQLHAQANQLIGGTKADFEHGLAALRGLPVVVNKWASWCAPCRGEFPLFQRVALRVGNSVALVGLDAQDNDGDARKFLKKFPLSYPSYRDPDLKIATSIQAGVAFPTTIFFNRRGKLVYAHPGPYSRIADLLADIRRYTGA